MSATPSQARYLTLLPIKSTARIFWKTLNEAYHKSMTLLRYGKKTLLVGSKKVVSLNNAFF